MEPLLTLTGLVEWPITRLKTMLTEKISSITEEPIANRNDITEVASIEEPPKKKRLFSFMKYNQGPEST